MAANKSGRTAGLAGRRWSLPGNIALGEDACPRIEGHSRSYCASRCYGPGGVSGRNAYSKRSCQEQCASHAARVSERNLKETPALTPVTALAAAACQDRLQQQSAWFSNSSPESPSLEKRRGLSLRAQALSSPSLRKRGGQGVSSTRASRDRRQPACAVPHRHPTRLPALMEAPPQKKRPPRPSLQG